MTPGEPTLHPNAGSSDLNRRLAAFERYAAVVRAQFQALQDEDVSRFSELAEDRAEIQSELGGEASEFPQEGAVDPKDQVRMAGVRKDMVEILALDKEIQRKLIRMRGHVASQIKEASSRRGGARKYLTQDSAADSERSTRLNVRF